VYDNIPPEDLPKHPDTLWQMFRNEVQRCQSLKAEIDRILMLPDLTKDGERQPEKTYEHLLSLCYRLIELKEMDKNRADLTSGLRTELQTKGQKTPAAGGPPKSKGKESKPKSKGGGAKTRMCKYHLEGSCTRGGDCTFAHHENQLVKPKAKSKTKGKGRKTGAAAETGSGSESSSASASSYQSSGKGGGGGGKKPICFMFAAKGRCDDSKCTFEHTKRELTSEEKDRKKAREARLKEANAGAAKSSSSSGKGSRSSSSGSKSSGKSASASDGKAKKTPKQKDKKKKKDKKSE
jgi:hypothetical protein